MKAAEVAERLNCSVSTVYDLIESGRLEHYRCPGVRVSEEQLACYLEETKRQRSSERVKSSCSHPRIRLRNVKL